MPTAASALPSWLPSRSLSSSETLCSAWKGSTCSAPLPSAGLESLAFPPPQPPQLPQRAPASSASFQCWRERQVGSSSGPCSFFQPSSPEPGAPTPESCSFLTPRKTLKPKGKSVLEWMMVFETFFKIAFAYSHGTIRLRWPHPHSFLYGQSRALSKPWGMGVKKLLLTQP